MYYFAINYILGVGCLGIPKALHESGFVLGGTVLLLTTFFSLLTVMWVAEAVARAEV
jgi:amino acid permease